MKVTIINIPEYYFKFISELLGILIWPIIIVVFIIILRNQLHELLNILIEKIRLSKSIKFSSSGFELSEKLDLAEIKIELIEEVQHDLQSLIQSAIKRVNVDLAQKGDDYYSKIELKISKFNSLQISDWDLRIAKKNELTAALSILIINSKIDYDTLLKKYTGDIISAVSYNIIINPKFIDLKILLTYNYVALSLFAKFKVVTALAVIISKYKLNSNDIIKIKEVLIKYQEGADMKLIKRILKVTKLIDSKI